ncbi:MAG: hypothetical protein GX804_03635 [Lentisphaerae bacterium]|nr:hypothetical protein [Lentisphaerota bacterium]
MKKNNKARLKKFLKRDRSTTLSVDELQGLMLQISYAIMMIFMIAYFMFKTKSTREQDEQFLELQKQRLIAAVEKVQNNYSIRYGLNTLLTIADDGTVSYDATAYIEQGRLTQTPVLRPAFSNGSANAAEDYANMLSLRRAWWDEVLELAEISEEALQHDNRIWLGERIDSSVTDLQREVVGVQVLSAALLQRYWTRNPDMIKDPVAAELLAEFQRSDESKRLLLATELARALRKYSLAYLSAEAGVPMLAE